MIATLPMYDWPEVRLATDAFWDAVASRLGVDLKLERGVTHEHSWRQPDLLFSQTCGYPLTHEFKGLLTYVATPHYRAPGCEGCNYSSFVFARSDAHALRKDRKAAINSDDSMSGMLALRLTGYDLRDRVLSGSHVNSLKMVQDGVADVCAIDAICVELARRHRPWLLDGLAEIGHSPLVPGLPFVTRYGGPAKIREALRDVFADPNLSEARSALLLDGYSDVGLAAYDRILDLERRLPS